MAGPSQPQRSWKACSGVWRGKPVWGVRRRPCGYGRAPRLPPHPPRRLRPEPATLAPCQRQARARSQRLHPQATGGVQRPSQGMPLGPWCLRPWCSPPAMCFESWIAPPRSGVHLRRSRTPKPATRPPRASRGETRLRTVPPSRGWAAMPSWRPQSGPSWPPTCRRGRPTGR